MTTALFLNGVYEDVLEEIIEAQSASAGRVCYLQPFKSERIRLLADGNPTTANPITLYISSTKSLSNVSYRAQVVGWMDKRGLSEEDFARLNAEMERYQPKEKEIYRKAEDGKDYVNLILVADLKRLDSDIPVSCFTKVSDCLPLGKRTRAGGWVPVNEPPPWLGETRMELLEDLVEHLRSEVRKSLRDDAEARQARLASAPRLPESVQVLSRAFRRNADVVAEVLLRARGVCERCGAPAPFARASDGSPYLEIHHNVSLSAGGEDTVANASALCPNCHRELHFGMAVSSISP